MMFASIFLAVFLYSYVESVTPPAGQTLGQPWPMPQSFKQTADALMLNSLTFKFTISGQDCDIIRSAMDRYYQLTFQVMYCMYVHQCVRLQ